VAFDPTSRCRTAAPEVMTSGASLRSPRCGEFWTAYTPGQPDEPHQPRPCSLYQKTFINRLRDDVIVVPAFSGGRLGPTRVPVPAKYGGLPHESVRFCEEVTTIDKEFLQRGPLGPLVEPGTVAVVVRAIRRAIGELVPS
jgi:mRNA-degrading endonuclease toxin of MazEF toxin-antitoxin module